MTSKASTVDAYLAELPEDRRAAIQAVREAIVKNLPKGVEEGMQYGTIGYFVPHSIYPKGYHCDKKQPLPFASLASQKNHMAMYLCGVYQNSETAEWFVKEWTKDGRKIDMGKGCVRFKKIEDVPLDLVGKVIARKSVEEYIADYEEVLSQPRPARR